MFMLWANGLLWTILSWLFYPPAIPYILKFVLGLTVILWLLGVKLWDYNRRDYFDIHLNGKVYHGFFRNKKQ